MVQRMVTALSVPALVIIVISVFALGLLPGARTTNARQAASPIASPMASPSPTIDLLATVQADQAANAAAAQQSATALATENGALRTALAGLATSEASAQQAASDAQSALGTAQADLANAVATIDQQATQIADLEASATANVLPTATPTATPTQTATPEPTATATITPTATPLPNAGDVLYEIGETGFQDWNGSSDWKILDGMLLNDGTAEESYIAAPYQPGVPNYAIEAEIQHLGGGRISLVARGGYFAGYSPTHGASIIVANTNDSFSERYRPGDAWHTYRIEVQGNRIRLLVDGEVIHNVVDNRYLDPGTIGLEASYAQVNVRSFTVIALENT